MINLFNLFYLAHQKMFCPYTPNSEYLYTIEVFFSGHVPKSGQTGQGAGRAMGDGCTELVCGLYGWAVLERRMLLPPLLGCPDESCGGAHRSRNRLQASTAMWLAGVCNELLCLLLYCW
jgi:hypothetical protein